ncbi:hemolysin-type calcium-binding repeat 2 copies family protein [Asticcacaulis biprosthecium C19]|uniref:Hemolysin-type calcium-binding repeat 2 copies family protein n=1 Tax=Asticcacaulis biprosthecium C19 TaxID=715226 RepID=F4QGJ8_9CAUL|nr:calcium-binding protein [Asticcacaulis biprosthecium]EGF93679.1 hemolysin-type calcium-binding repeat 2 copies family protein [Asticcacaulis biprosthecium C19]
MENAEAGTDLILASVSYNLGADIENLTFTGTGNLTGNGNNMANVLTGNSGNNWLEGAAGVDTLIGGLGNDTFVVDNEDSVVENAGEGNDWVLAARSYTLGANLEHLALSGSGNFTATGNSLANRIGGNSGNNWIDGLGGNDTLAGGLGNDTYVVDVGGDAVTEAAGDGTDMVQASLTYGLGANLENLVLTGAGNINGTGNDLNNILTGNAGNNALDGGAGADRMVGGLGNDTYYVDNVADSVGENHLEGADTIISSVSYSLNGRAVEVLTLTGTGNLTGVGNSLNNIMTGNDGKNTLEGAAGNDVLDGGAGADRLLGGLGDDTYYVDNIADSVGENHLEGTDTIISSVNYSLNGRAVEVLTLTGGGNLNGTGNSLNNTLTGNAGNNVLDGGAGVDKLVGGLGDDTYYVDNTGDNVQELHLQGTDTVFSSVTYSLLGRAVEVLNLTGSGNINATGNSLNNALMGNSGNNRLDGGVGNDTLTGGLGSDVFVFLNGTWKDTVTDFSAAQNDSIDLHAITNGVANNGMVTQVGGNVLINLGGGNTITVLGATQADVLSHMVW